MLNHNKLYNDVRTEYMSDIYRIIDVCKKHGEFLTVRDASKLWEKHSDDYCAGWLILPESDEKLWRDIEYYFI